MDEIDPKAANIDKIFNINPDIKSKNLQQNKRGSFDKILTDQIDESSHKDSGSTKEISLQEIQGTFKAQKIGLEPDPSQLMKKLYSSLNRLDQYARMLQNPDKTLKQAWRLLEELTTDARTMEKQFSDNNFSDKGLKTILTQLLTTVEVENIKFTRGDYT